MRGSYCLKRFFGVGILMLSLVTSFGQTISSDSVLSTPTTVVGTLIVPSGVVVTMELGSALVGTGVLVVAGTMQINAPTTFTTKLSLVSGGVLSISSLANLTVFNSVDVVMGASLLGSGRLICGDTLNLLPGSGSTLVSCPISCNADVTVSNGVAVQFGNNTQLTSGGLLASGASLTFGSGFNQIGGNWEMEISARLMLAAGAILTTGALTTVSSSATERTEAGSYPFVVAGQFYLDHLLDLATNCEVVGGGSFVVAFGQSLTIATLNTLHLLDGASVLGTGSLQLSGVLWDENLSGSGVAGSISIFNAQGGGPGANPESAINLNSGNDDQLTPTAIALTVWSIVAVFASIVIGVECYRRRAKGVMSNTTVTPTPHQSRPQPQPQPPLLEQVQPESPNPPSIQSPPEETTPLICNETQVAQRHTDDEGQSSITSEQQQRQPQLDPEPMETSDDHRAISVTIEPIDEALPTTSPVLQRQNGFMIPHSPPALNGEVNQVRVAPETA